MRNNNARLIFVIFSLYTSNREVFQNRTKINIYAKSPILENSDHQIYELGNADCTFFAKRVIKPVMMN